MASLEERIDSLTSAVTRLADLMEAGGGASAAPDKPKADKPKAGAKPKKTADDVKAAIVLVKDTIGEDDARAIIQKHAGAGKKLADLVAMPAKFDAVCADCAAALAAAESGEEAEEETEDDGL